VNATKYGDDDAPIGISVRDDDGQLRLEVKNVGRAIEHSVMNRIFEPLQRSATHETEDFSGSLGLGLYIARQIVEAHGGVITARSDPTETVFAVRLPRQQSRAVPV
jgi:signal transduction histidine kinase